MPTRSTTSWTSANKLVHPDRAPAKNVKSNMNAVMSVRSEKNINNLFLLMLIEFSTYQLAIARTIKMPVIETKSVI
jgi:hypothetical protein